MDSSENVLVCNSYLMEFTIHIDHCVHVSEMGSGKPYQHTEVIQCPLDKQLNPKNVPVPDKEGSFVR